MPRGGVGYRRSVGSDEIDDDGSYPLVAGFLHRQGQQVRLRVWCLFCCVWHTHGDDPVGSVEHRTAHCFAPDSEYRQGGGYLVQVSRRSFAQVSGLVKEATPQQREQIQRGEITEAIAKLRAQTPPAA